MQLLFLIYHVPHVFANDNLFVLRKTLLLQVQKGKYVYYFLYSSSYSQKGTFEFTVQSADLLGCQKHSSYSSRYNSVSIYQFIIKKFLRKVIFGTLSRRRIGQSHSRLKVSNYFSNLFHPIIMLMKISECWCQQYDARVGLVVNNTHFKRNCAPVTMANDKYFGIIIEFGLDQLDKLCGLINTVLKRDDFPSIWALRFAQVQLIEGIYISSLDILSNFVSNVTKKVSITVQPMDTKHQRFRLLMLLNKVVLHFMAIILKRRLIQKRNSEIKRWINLKLRNVHYL